MDDTSYKGASLSAKELLSWRPLRHSADVELDGELSTLVARSRDLIRNNGIASGAIQTLVDNVIGNGLKLVSIPDHRILGLDLDYLEEWARKVESLWRIWSESVYCDAARKLNFNSQTALIFRSVIENGEAWRFFNGRRSWIINYWAKPVFELWLEEVVNKGLIEAPCFYENKAAWCRCKWIGPGRGWVDPVKEAQASQIRMESGLSSKTIQWKAEARLVDDEGNALGDWIVLGSESHTAAQNTPIRLTFFYMVSLGRYEVRMVRLDAKDTSARAAHAIYWESLKGYMEAPSDFGEMTLLAIKMRATNNLSSNSSRKINAIVNRKVKTWSSNSGWSEPVKTRSIAWAIADILTAPYGGKLSDERIHLTELEQLDKVWESRGDYFDGIFDSTTTIWEAMLKVARCGRAIPILQAGMIRIIRDDKKTIPTAMFTPRNIVKDSFSIEYIMPSEDTADSVKVQYFSSKYWKYDDVTTKLADSTEENPANVDLFGCTNKEHAAREGYYMCACNRYRRKYISFQTELEGLIPTYGDLISITHDMCEWGQGGEVLSVSGNTLKLSEHLMWKENEEHFICFRHKDGSMSETYPVIRGAVDEEAVIQTVPDIKIYTGTAMERTHFTFGIKGKVSMYAKVIGVKPRGDTVEISCVNESDEVYKT